MKPRTPRSTLPTPSFPTRRSSDLLRAVHVVQGGSTLTQQLIKNFFLTSKQTWDRKFNEASMAMLLESHYSKDEILEAYLNEVHLGQDGNRAVHGLDRKSTRLNSSH